MNSCYVVAIAVPPSGLNKGGHMYLSRAQEDSPTQNRGVWTPRKICAETYRSLGLALSEARFQRENGIPGAHVRELNE